jgi:hypothetical protein
MNKLHNRLTRIEKRRDEKPADVMVIEIYGVSLKGEERLMERRTLDPKTNQWTTDKNVIYIPDNGREKETIR